VATLPDPATDPRSAETALAVALGGAICPVPFVMSAAAMRIARPRASRRARVAYWLAAATMVLQAAVLVALAVVLAL
jgi:hypothetical protein